MLRIIGFIISAAVAFGLTTAATKSSELTVVKAIVANYQKSAAVTARVEKEVTFALLGENKKSSGRMDFSKGRLRLEIDKPDPSLIVMNKKLIWVVTPTPEELGGKTQVLKISSQEMSKQSKAPLAVLLGKKEAWDNFKVKNSQTKDGVLALTLVPTKPNVVGEIVSMQIEVSIKENVLKLLSYKDELDNETKFIFSKTKLDAKVDDKLFVYLPPKNAEITEYK
jgi:outer membrane lipoprotein-sorting protein